MIDPPYRTVGVASAFSPRFLQVLAEGKRVRDRLCRQLQLIYVGSRDDETARKFSAAFSNSRCPEVRRSIIRKAKIRRPRSWKRPAGMNRSTRGWRLGKKWSCGRFLATSRGPWSKTDCSVILFTKPEEPKPFCRIAFLADYS
jgi:hypothetical protein